LKLSVPMCKLVNSVVNIYLAMLASLVVARRTVVTLVSVDCAAANSDPGSGTPAGTRRWRLATSAFFFFSSLAAHGQWGVVHKRLIVFNSSLQRFRLLDGKDFDFLETFFDF